MTKSENFHWKFRSVIVSGQPVPPNCFEGMNRTYDAISALYGITEAGFSFIAGKIHCSSEPRGDEIIGMLPLTGMVLKWSERMASLFPVVLRVSFTYARPLNSRDT